MKKILPVKICSLFTAIVLMLCFCGCEKEGTSSDFSSITGVGDTGSQQTTPDDVSSDVETSLVSETSETTTSSDSAPSSKPETSSKPEVSSKLDSSSKPTSSNKSEKPEYSIKENTSFTYSGPILISDSEYKDETYYVMRYLTLDFYPKGATFFDAVLLGQKEYTTPVVEFTVSEFKLIPKKGKCGQRLEGIKEYLLSYVDSSKYKWEDFFKNKKLVPEEYYIVKVGNQEYLEYHPPIGGDLSPLYSYDIDKSNGKVTTQKVNVQQDGYELLSVKLKPNSEKKLVAKYVYYGQEAEIEMTRTK